MGADDEFYDWYILEINPEPWAVGPIQSARRDGRMTAYMGQNAQLAAYKEAIKEELDSLETRMHDGKISLRFYFWRTRDDYETAQGRRHRKHEADLTNLQKATEDALQGILFKNDKDVVHVQSVMVDQSPTSPGRVVVGVGQARDVMFRDYPFDKLEVLKKKRPATRTRDEVAGQLMIEDELF